MPRGFRIRYVLCLQMHFVCNCFDILVSLEIMLYSIDHVYIYIFSWYNFVSFKKDSISSMSTFSNSSFILFTLKRYFLIWVKAFHYMRKHLSAGFWHVLSSCLIIEECFSLVWTAHDQDKVTCFFNIIEKWMKNTSI